MKLRILFLATFVALATFGLQAQTTLVTYTFDNGSLKPAHVHDGVVAGKIAKQGKNKQLSFKAESHEDRSCLVINTSLNMNSTDYIYFPIAPEQGKKIRITEVRIKHRKATDNTTLGAMRSFLFKYNGEKSTPKGNLIYRMQGEKANGISLVKNNAWINKGTYKTRMSAKDAASVVFNSEHRVSLGAAVVKGQKDGEWWIDEIELVGEVLEQ